VQRIFRRYLVEVVGAHTDDPRIWAWDLCNEPLMGPYVTDPDSVIRAGELRWLTWCRDVCRAAGATQPLSIGNYGNIDAIALTEPLSDFISFHPYFIPNWRNGPTSTPERFESLLDAVVTLAQESGKSLLANETVWGAVDDAEHVEFLRYTLGQLVARDIGFTVHALHHSLVADLHSQAFGPVGRPGRLEFINADGSLRVGHETFNDFTGAQ
jgi:hypothetical protein